MSVKKATLAAMPTTDIGEEALLLKAKSLFKRLRWLSPPSKLSSATSSSFGRNIEKALNGLDKGKGLMMLKLRRQDTAVVMSLERYKEMLQMKEACAQLLEAEAHNTISQAANDYDSLYQRISSPASRQAADALFAVGAEELRTTYGPGRTESS